MKKFFSAIYVLQALLSHSSFLGEKVDSFEYNIWSSNFSNNLWYEISDHINDKRYFICFCTSAAIIRYAILKIKRKIKVWKGGQRWPTRVVPRWKWESSCAESNCVSTFALFHRDSSLVHLRGGGNALCCYYPAVNVLQLLIFSNCARSCQAGVTPDYASGQQSTVDASKRDKVVVTPQILSYYSELKMWTVDKKLGALCGLCMTSERSIVVATQLRRQAL